MSFDQLFRVNHQPPDNITAGQPVTVRIQINAAAGIKWVRLCYRAVNQQVEYNTLSMTPTQKENEFEVVIPASVIDTTRDLMYYIEMMDKNDNGRIYPDVERKTPYKIITFIRK